MTGLAYAVDRLHKTNTVSFNFEKIRGSRVGTYSSSTGLWGILFERCTVGGETCSSECRDSWRLLDAALIEFRNQFYRTIISGWTYTVAVCAFALEGHGCQYLRLWTAPILTSQVFPLAREVPPLQYIWDAVAARVCARKRTMKEVFMIADRLADGENRCRCHWCCWHALGKGLHIERVWWESPRMSGLQTVIKSNRLIRLMSSILFLTIQGISTPFIQCTHIGDTSIHFQGKEL